MNKEIKYVMLYNTPSVRDIKSARSRVGEDIYILFILNHVSGEDYKPVLDNMTHLLYDLQYSGVYEEESWRMDYMTNIIYNQGITNFNLTEVFMGEF